eukprot:3723296-Pleurochrysis_carterae.AAC.1
MGEASRGKGGEGAVRAQWTAMLRQDQSVTRYAVNVTASGSWSPGHSIDNEVLSRLSLSNETVNHEKLNDHLSNRTISAPAVPAELA